MNEKETHILPDQIPVDAFEPIDIFAQPPRKLRPVLKWPGKRWRRAAENPETDPQTGDSPYVRPVRRSPENYEMPEETREKPDPEPLNEGEKADALYLHAAAGKLAARGIFAWLGRLLPGAIPNPAAAAALMFHAIILAFPVLRRAVSGDEAAEKMRFRRPVRGCMWLCFACGLGAALFGVGITDLWGRALTAWGADLPGAISIRPGQLPLLMVTGALLPAVCEELFFRGYLLSEWEERWGRAGIVICAVLFTLIHGSVQGLPAQMTVGILLGCICVYSGSVFCAILAHLGYDMGVILLGVFWQPSGWGQDVWVVLFGGALAMAFYLLMCRVSGRRTVNLPTRQATGWESGIAMYAAVVTLLLMYAEDILSLFGGV